MQRRLSVSPLVLLIPLMLQGGPLMHHVLLIVLRLLQHHHQRVSPQPRLKHGTR